MKVYKDNEIIKAAKYRQCALGFLNRMEKEGDVKLIQVTVDDNIATFHYEGVREGSPIAFDIPVKKNKQELGITCTYGGKTRAFDFGQYFDRGDFDIWLNSVAKLDSDEAKAGTLPMLVEDWLTIPGNKEFYEKAKAAFLPYAFTDIHLDADRFVAMPQDKLSLCTAMSKDHPVLVYNADINDFSLSKDIDEMHYGFCITSRRTVIVTYNVSEYHSRLNELMQRMFPEFTSRLKGSINTYFYIETDLETAVGIVSSSWNRMLDVYGEEAKRHGMPDSWRTATSWTKDGPVYPKGSAEAKQVDGILAARKDEVIDRHTKNIISLFERRYNTKLPDYFEGAEFLHETEDWCVEYPHIDHYLAFLSIPYKFPKVKGSKVTWAKKSVKVRIYYTGHNDRLVLEYVVPAKFTVMCGTYEWFHEAQKHDDEKQMIIQGGRARQKEVGFSGIKHLKERLDEIQQFAKYKGFE